MGSMSVSSAIDELLSMYCVPYAVYRWLCVSPRQLGWLKRLKQHMALPSGREVWIWFDLLSIPQRSRDLQIKAIGSLCSYTQLCTRRVAQNYRARLGV